MTIGGGQVYPEVNFTLPTMNIEAGTWTEVVSHYEQMAAQILRSKAVALVVDQAKIRQRPGGCE